MRKQGHRLYKAEITHPFYQLYKRLRHISNQKQWEYPDWDEFFIWAEQNYIDGCRLTRHDLDKPFTYENMYFSKQTTKPDSLKKAVNKRKEKCLEKYGVEHYTQTKECQEKRVQTCLERYGVDHPSKNPEILAKQLNVHIQKYGKIFNQTKKIEENEVRQIIEDFGLETKSYRLQSNKEIDIYIPSLKIGIEYCSIYWHNELSKDPKSRSYHYDKYKQAKKEDIYLITIFSNEWIYRKEQCINRLKSLCNTHTKIGARLCDVNIIDNHKAKNFIDAYHIQILHKTPLLSIGLTYNSELVGVMTFNKHPRSNQEICLDRMCFSMNIVGGASKMLKLAKTKISQSIISWSDNRWSNGDIYTKLGFSLIDELGPDYMYVKMNTVKNPNKFIHKQLYSRKDILPKNYAMKSKTGCPKEISERDFMIEQGFGRIWDCGKKKWQL